MRLDRRITAAVRAFRAEPQAPGEPEPLLGIYISDAQVDRWLASGPGVRVWAADATSADLALPGPLSPEHRLARLGAAFGLEPFELAVVVVALAPEFDGRYERLYAYLQDDATRRFVSVELALQLLAVTPAERLARRAHFAAGAPLVRHRLLQLQTEPGPSPPPLLATRIGLDPQVAGFLLAVDQLDGRLRAFAERLDPAEAALPPAELASLVVDGRARGETPLLHLHGPEGTGKRQAALGVAGVLGRALLLADLGRMPLDEAAFEQPLALLFQRQRLYDEVLCLHGLEALEGAREQRLLAWLEEPPGPVLLASTRLHGAIARGRIEALAFRFRAPEAPERRALWARAVTAALAPRDDAVLDELAERFELGPLQIERAVRVACARARLRGGRPDRTEMFAAARDQCGHDLGHLARRLEPVYAFEDLVLPDEPMAQLRGLCERVRHRRRVLDGWGMGRKLPLGRGVTALFTGASGTGKTMAAAILGRELGLDVYRIDLAQVVSKYIGETEKNLARLFDAAEGANAILFFDEAEALFGKRSEVKDAHDRYANIEIGYLLQRMEEYCGIAILATNLRQNLDEAFLRRLQVIVEFPSPGEAERLRLWRGLFPPEAPLAADVDLGRLAREVRLPGGNLQSIALAAAFLAAAEGGPIAMAHLQEAARREHRKIGRPWPGSGA